MVRDTTLYLGNGSQVHFNSLISSSFAYMSYAKKMIRILDSTSEEINPDSPRKFLTYFFYRKN